MHQGKTPTFVNLLSGICFLVQNLINAIVLSPKILFFLCGKNVIFFCVKM